MKELGRDTILADVRDGLSDDDAIELFYDNNLNQQSFDATAARSAVAPYG